MSKNQLDAKTRYDFYKWLESKKEDFNYKTFAYILTQSQKSFRTDISRGHLLSALKVIPIKLVRSEKEGKLCKEDVTRKHIHTLAIAVSQLFDEMGDGSVPNVILQLVEDTRKPGLNGQEKVLESCPRG